MKLSMLSKLAEIEESIRNAKIEARNLKANTMVKYYNDDRFRHTSNEDLKRLWFWGNAIGKNLRQLL